MIKDDDHRFERLAAANLTEAERNDDGHDKAGLVAQFHRTAGRVACGGTEDELLARQGKHLQLYARAELGLALGDAVRVTANGNDKSGKPKLKTGSVYQVKGFTRQGDITLDNGWVFDKSFGHICHGYVSTSHASQGRTVDVVLVSESSGSFPTAGAEQHYVSVSRGKRSAHVYTDDLPALREAVARRRPNDNASDLVGRQPAGKARCSAGRSS